MKNETTTSLEARNLRIFREAFSLKQSELAKEVGVSRTCISYYESRIRNISDNFIKAVCSHFLLRVDDFLISDEKVARKRFYEAYLKWGIMNGDKKAVDMFEHIVNAHQRIMEAIL